MQVKYMGPGQRTLNGKPLSRGDVLEGKEAVDMLKAFPQHCTVIETLKPAKEPEEAQEPAKKRRAGKAKSEDNS